ncbi:MAG: hypothetical protein II839_01255, partial [Kiritimatiellae bacterium]|nr:hypothetical protein [Kiritimatiellia bacterium]
MKTHVFPAVLALSVLAAASVRAQEAGPSPLAAECAALVLQDAGSARWILADGPLVPALRAAAKAAGSGAVVLPLLGG